MNFKHLTPTHLNQVASILDEQGIPRANVWGHYYLIIQGKEYPLGYTAQAAYQLATGEKVRLPNDEELRTQFVNMGYEVLYYEEGINFFTPEELAFYASVVKTDYRKDNPAHRYYQQKIFPILEKAKYWAMRLQGDDFHLRKDGRWISGYVSRIKPYIWPRIYTGEDKDVFFNVEVNGEKQFIGYKLDGYYETVKALPAYKIKILDAYKEAIGWEWPQIPFNRIGEYTWARLIDESKAYIQQYRPHHDHLKALFAKEHKLARITWNTNGWVIPSGYAGKSIHASYEKENGFGHEEWLFDGEKTMGGYKFGFLEPVHKHRATYEGKTFDLTLYTRNAQNGQAYWVGNLQGVAVLAPDEAKKVFDHYKSNGWFDEMKQDLANLNLDATLLDEWVAEGAEALFNIKFKTDQLHAIPAALLPIEETDSIPTSRYILMDILPQTVSQLEKAEHLPFSFEESGSAEADLSTQSTRTHRAKVIEMELTHNLLQSKFLQYLQGLLGKAVVKRECRAYGSARIDVTVKTDTGYEFYEIKTYNSLLASIREAVGQLLEYALYPKSKNVEKLVLVSHVVPKKEDIAYILQLKAIIQIPFSYICFDMEAGKVISEI